MKRANAFALASAVASLCVARPGAAQPDSTEPAFGVISTSATATRRLPNTVADVRCAIEVHARDLPAVSRTLAQSAENLLGYLRSQSVERLQTELVSIETELQEQTRRPDRIKGYTARSAVTFRTVPDRLPAQLAGCLSHGADTIEQTGASPREAEIDAAGEELAAEAVKTALRQADAMARAAGKTISGLSSITVQQPEGVQRPSPAMAATMAPRRKARLDAIATEAGDAGLSVTVALVARVGN